MLASNLVHRCDLVEQARGQRDAFGAVEREPYATIVSSLPCLIRPLSAKAQVRDNAGRMLISHTVYFNRNPGFGRSRMLRSGSRTFEIIGVVDHLERGTDVHVSALEILPEAPS